MQPRRLSWHEGTFSRTKCRSSLNSTHWTSSRQGGKMSSKSRGGCWATKRAVFSVRHAIYTTKMLPKYLKWWNESYQQIQKKCQYDFRTVGIPTSKRWRRTPLRKPLTISSTKKGAFLNSHAVSPIRKRHGSIFWCSVWSGLVITRPDPARPHSAQWILGPLQPKTKQPEPVCIGPSCWNVPKCYSRNAKRAENYYSYILLPPLVLLSL